MRLVIEIVIVLAIFAGVGAWFVYGRAAKEKEGSGQRPAAGPEKAAPPVPITSAHARKRDVPIYLKGLGNVQAFQTVTIHPQIDGVINKIEFKEGQLVHIGEPLIELDARTYKAQLDQAKAKKKQDEAKRDQDRAHVLQDHAKKAQDQARKIQDEAIEQQAKSKKAQDAANLANARVNLKRFEESLAMAAVSQQQVTDQRSLVTQLESLVQADESAIQAAAAAVKSDEAAILGDDAAIGADMALVASDEAVIASDEAAINYAETFLSYATIASPIDGRTGVKLLDVGNLVRANDSTGIVVITQLQPISVIFTLPQQYLLSINEQFAKGPLTVIANDQDDKIELDRGTLLLVDNQIDPTTGNIRLKATFPNTKNKLWPGGFVNAHLLLETRKDAITLSAPAVQQGPNGTFVFLIKPDANPALPPSVEVRPIKVEELLGVRLIQDGKALIAEGLSDGDEVVRSGHDKLQAGSKVKVDKPADKDKAKPADEPAKDNKDAKKPAGEGANKGAGK